MSRNQHEDADRVVWSCSLVPVPEESETEALEAALCRKELPLREDARALERYLRLSGLSQAACAARLGRSQAAVANRLRLLQLSEDVLERLARGELTERHARALLRLPGEAEQSRTAELFARRRMSVAEAERHVDRLLSPEGAADALSRERKDALNRIWAELERMRHAVPEVSMSLRDGGGCVILEIRLPKG